MMYSEFLEMSMGEKKEDYITFNEYTKYIEPIYTACNLPDKYEFIELFDDLFEKMVYTVVENNIKALPLRDKYEYIHGDRPDIQKKLDELDRRARMVMYAYLKMYLAV